MLWGSSSSIVINFAYDLYQNYNIVKIKENSGLNSFEIEVTNSTMVTKENLKECVLSLSDAMIITIPVFILSSILYNKLILPFLDKSFAYMKASYNFKIYTFIFLIYIITFSIVLLLMILFGFSGKTLMENKAGKY